MKFRTHNKKKRAAAIPAEAEERPYRLPVVLKTQVTDL